MRRSARPKAPDRKSSLRSTDKARLNIRFGGRPRGLRAPHFDVQEPLGPPVVRFLVEPLFHMENPG